MQLNDLFSDAEINQLENTGALTALSQETEPPPVETEPPPAQEPASEPQAPSELDVMKEELEKTKALVSEKDKQISDLLGKVDLLINSVQKSQAPRGDETPEVDMLAILSDSQKAPQLIGYIARREAMEMIKPLLPMFQELAGILDQRNFAKDKPDVKEYFPLMEEIRKENPELNLTMDQAYTLAKKYKKPSATVQNKTEKPPQPQTKTQVSVDVLREKNKLNTTAGITPSNGTKAQPVSLRQILSDLSADIQDEDLI